MNRFAALLALALMAAQEEKPAPLQVDERAGTLSFGARATDREKYEERLKGVIEFTLVMPGGKEYEALFVCPVDALALYEGMKKIGLKPGKPAEEDDAGRRTPPQGSKLRIWVEGAGEKKRLEAFVLDSKTGKPMVDTDWVFTGSREGFDPNTEKTTLQVVMGKNLAGLLCTDANPLIQNPEMVADAGHRYKANKEVQPKAGSLVKIIFEPVK